VCAAPAVSWARLLACMRAAITVARVFSRHRQGVQPRAPARRPVERRAGRHQGGAELQDRQNRDGNAGGRAELQHQPPERGAHAFYPGSPPPALRGPGQGVPCMGRGQRRRRTRQLATGKRGAVGACECTSPRLTRRARPQVHLYNTMVVREALTGGPRDRHERSEHPSTLSMSPSQASASHDSDLFETWMVMGAAQRLPRCPRWLRRRLHGAQLRGLRRMPLRLAHLAAPCAGGRLTRAARRRARQSSATCSAWRRPSRSSGCSTTWCAHAACPNAELGPIEITRTAWPPATLHARHAGQADFCVQF